MDPYNLIQEQLATINNNLNNSLAKIHDEVVTLSKRVESLENNTRDQENNFINRIDDIEQTLLILPKIYNNQVSLIETQLVGHQYQFKRISNIITKDSEVPPFANITTNSTGSNNNNQLVNTTTSGAGNGAILNATNGGISSQNRVNSPIPLNQQSRINQANRVNQSNATSVNLPLNRGPSSNNVVPSRRATTTSTRSFMNVPLEHDHTIGSLSNQTINPQRSQSLVGTNDVNDVLPSSGGGNNNNNDNNVGAEDEDEDGITDPDSFHKLNPNPKSVQEVLEEYYYGYQGQPSLKYLEENQKRWRKGNKNLSKTFSRRYRVVTAVEMGTQMYASEMGGNEQLAKERVINELENLRTRENGGRETMYWLFHHIPDHLKRKR